MIQAQNWGDSLPRKVFEWNEMKLEGFITPGLCILIYDHQNCLEQGERE
jgi:hypothetical protein